MKLYVVRHGSTNENMSKIMQGEMDTILNDGGREQARDAKKKLDGIHFDAVYASPKKRTWETANIIAGDDYIIIPDARLKSRNHGEFQGMARGDVNLKEYWNYNINRHYVTAENIQDLYHRVGSFIEFLKKEYPNGTVLIVTHSGVCRTLYYYFNGIPENGDMLDGYEAETGRVEIYNV